VKKSDSKLYIPLGDEKDYMVQLTMEKGLKIEGLTDKKTLELITENPTLQTAAHEQPALMDLLNSGYVIQGYGFPRALMRHPETQHTVMYDTEFKRINHTIFKGNQPKPY